MWAEGGKILGEKIVFYQIYDDDISMKFFQATTKDYKDIVVTPEPTSMLLFGIGGAAMALLRRKK